jgi:hypothetical protein
MNSGAKDWDGNLTLDGGGWAKSDMRAWLNGEDFYGNLPADLKNVIKTVTKLSDNGYYDYHPGPASLTPTDDKIFIASAEELNALNKRYTMAGQGEPYVLFTDDASRKMDGLYWTRSTAGAQSFHAFCVVDGDGRITTTGGGNKADIIVYFSV